MTATVRTYCHAGVTTAKVKGGTNYATDSIGLLIQPYLARDSVTVDTGTAQSIDAAPAGTTLLRVQIQAGKSVHCEIVPPGSATVADTGSPILSGEETVQFGVGWTASFLEAEIV